MNGPSPLDRVAEVIAEVLREERTPWRVEPIEWQWEIAYKAASRLIGDDLSPG